MNELTKVNFDTFKIGAMEGYAALIKVSEEQKSKTGNPYINLLLYGENGTKKYISIFVPKEDFNIPERSVIKGNFSYKGEFLNLNSYEPKPDINISEFVRSAPVAPETCYNIVIKTLKSLNYESEKLTLYDIAIAVLEKYKDKLMFFPASELMHHNYLGGLIYHTMSMVKTAFNLTRGEYEVNREIVISAVAVNTICKVFTLDCDEISAESNLYNYLYNDGELSLRLIDTIRDELIKTTNKTYDKNKYLNFSVCIKSYKGKPAWGASIMPLTSEAYLVTMINQLDSHMDMYKEAKASASPNKLSDYIDCIHTRVLNI